MANASSAAGSKASLPELTLRGIITVSYTHLTLPTKA